MSESQKYINIFTGIMLALAFPPLPFYPIAFIAFIPMLFVIEKFSDKKFNLSLSFYISFFIFHTGSNWWISSFQEQTDPFLMASGFALDVAHPLFFFIPVYLFRWIKRKWKSPLSNYTFPFIWTSFEWVHSLGEFSYPWLTIGNNQIYNFKWIQFIDITGVWGSSFLICLINVILFELFYSIYKLPKEDRLAGYIFRLPGNGIRISIVALLFLLPIIYGDLRLNSFEHEELMSKNESINVSIVQPNINPWEKWGTGPGGQIDMLIDLQDSVLKKNKNIDLSIWPETSILRIGRKVNSDLNMSFIQYWVDKNEISLLSGFIHDYEYATNEKRQVSARFREYDSTWLESFNSAVLVQPGSPSQVYHKSKLTPFAERIPYVNYASFLMDYIQWGVGISSWGLGEGASALDLYHRNKQYKIGNIICIESIYPGFCRDFTKDGAQLLTLITNDAWYDGTPGPEQHYLIAQIRAIENRRYIARCANSGISGFISASGRSLKQAEQYKQEVITMSIPFLNEMSFYAKHGDWFGYFVFFVSLGVIVIGYFKSTE